MTELRQKIPRVISFVANKGGVGKTRMAILTANCLGAAGKRVLVLDLDFNNSATLYYLIDGQEETVGDKNTAAALSREENDIFDYALATVHPGVWYVASSRYLADLRGINEKRLGRMMPRLAGKIDVVIIDSQPDYNNLTLNAINAGDLIVTPVLKDVDSFNAALFLAQKISLETEKSENWYININGYNKTFENAKGGKQKEYIEIYRKNFPRITPCEAWYPWSAAMNEVKDYKRPLSRAAISGAAYSPELYRAVVRLSEFCVGSELIVAGEVF
jgi:chromosome partitioning protein